MGKPQVTQRIVLIRKNDQAGTLRVVRQPAS